MSTDPPIPEIQHFQSLTFKIPGQCHSSRSQNRYNTLSTHIPFIPCQSALPFLGYSYSKIFDVENSRSRSKVRSKLKVATWVQYSVNSHPFRSMSIGHPIPDLRLLTLKIKGQRVQIMVEVTSKSQCGSSILSTHIPFVPCQSCIPFLSYDF